MSKRKQKIVLEGFTFTIGKLILEHESDEFDPDELTNDVQNVIGQLVTAPSKLVIAEAANSRQVQQSPPAFESPSKPKSRRRKRSAPRSGDNAIESSGDRTTRTKPNSARSLIEELKTDGYFAQDRSISEVREELHTRGHSFKPNQLSSPLLSMTKNKALSRRKDESGTWVYRAS